MLPVRYQNLAVILAFIFVVLTLAYFQTASPPLYFHITYCMYTFNSKILKDSNSFVYSLATELPCDTKFDPDKVEVFSWEPRIFIYKNFLSDEECDHFISRGLSEGLKRSAVATAPGQEDKSEARTSYGTFLEDDGDIVMRRVESRIAQWSQIPVEHGEVWIILNFFYSLLSVILLELLFVAI